MNRKDLYEQFLSTKSLFNMPLSPIDCYLVRRGLNTLRLRMRQHMKNAYQVACFLEQHPAIERVFYPALSSHPQHEIYKKQGGASGMCSYILAKNADVKQFLIELKICTVAVSLGGCETLIESPALMTHRSTLYAIETKEEEMSENLIRMSVGLENVRDIIKDLDRALYRSINQENTTDYNEDWELIEEAKQILNRSHSLTASALRTTSGRIYSGIHFGLFTTICGEISAISAMVNDGHQDLSTIVVLRGFDDDKNRFEILNPCDKCREFIRDFNPNTQIIVGTVDKPYRKTIKNIYFE